MAIPTPDTVNIDDQAEFGHEVDLTNFPIVKVGPFEVAALTQSEVVNRIVNWPEDKRPAVFNHLHVGALNFRDESTFVNAMNDADLVYADGMATVLIGRLSGAEELERAGLTDIGHDIVKALNVRLGRPARIAFLGGPDGLADRAAQEMKRLHGIDPVFTAHGYRDTDEWSETLLEVCETKPDALFIGLGMPREAIWAMEHRHELPDALVMSAGGFFGHIVGDEKRAPEWAQKTGLEWVWRVAQQPKHLGGRYAKGLFTTAKMSAEAVIARRGNQES